MVARALREVQPLVRDHGPLFKWRPGVPIDNDEGDSNNTDAPYLEEPSLEIHGNDDEDGIPAPLNMKTKTKT